MKMLFSTLCVLFICAAPLQADEQAAASATPAAWALPFKGEVLEAVIGEQHAYYLLHLPNASADAPGRADALAAVNPLGQSTDWRLAAVCVQLNTGKIAWSRLVGSNAHIAVDPRDDTLYLFNRHCIALAAKDGSVTKQIEPDGDRHIDAIAAGSQILGPDPSALAGNRHMKWSLLNPDTRSMVKLDVAAARLLSPDEKYRLDPLPSSSLHQLQCQSVADGSNAWVVRLDEIGAPILHRTDPRWFGDKVYWLVGASNRKSQMLCLAGDTGSVLWQQTLPDGCYTANQHALVSNAASPNFTPFTVDEQRAMVIDEAGRIHCFDPVTGEVKGQLHAARVYLCMPAVRDKHLIVVTHTAIRSYPLDIISSGAPDPAMLKPAQQLLAAGHTDQALTLTLQMIEEDLDFAPAYRLAADALEQLHRTDDAIFFRAQALCLSGGGHDPALESQIGLHKIIALGSPASPTLMPYQGSLLVGTRDGRLLAIDPQTLNVRLLATTPNEIDRLYPAASPIAAADNASRHNLHPLPLAAKFDEPQPHADSMWNRRTGRDGRSVYYRGSFYRPTIGGVLQFDPDKNKTVLHPLPLTPESSGSSNTQWFIALNESAPHFGYGAGGVTVLDDNLCPDKWLVHLPEGRAKHLLAGSDDFCIECAQRKQPRQLRIYSREGELLRAADTTGLSYWSLPDSIIRLNGGYLMCGTELLYLHPDANVSVSRIAPPADKLIRRIDPTWNDRYDFFGPPVLSHDRIFTVSHDGCIYVFDADFFGRPTANQPHD